MTSDLWLFLVLLAIAVALIVVMLFHLLTLEELRIDHKHPKAVCDSLNPWILPEYYLHAFSVVLLVWTGEWLLVVPNLAILAYHARRFVEICRPDELGERPVLHVLAALVQARKRYPGIYDPTGIHQQHLIRQRNLVCSIKLGGYLLLFFVYLYRVVTALITRPKTVVSFNSDGFMQ